MPALRNAMRQSFALWGGRYNPIIPINDEVTADALVRLFRVDMLMPATQSAKTAKYIEKFKYLPNPLHADSLFASSTIGQKKARLLDIFHPMKRFFDDHLRNNAAPVVGISVLEWDETDVLSDVFLASFGALPLPAVTGIDYASVAKTDMKADTLVVAKGGALPPIEANRYNLNFFSRAYLKQHHSLQNHDRQTGVYIGDAQNFDDLVSFWNLRACDENVIFHDPNHAARFEDYQRSWLKLTRDQRVQFSRTRGISVWARDDKLFVGSDALGEAVSNHQVRPETWNGFNQLAPYMYFSEESILATVEDRSPKHPKLTFQLPEKPFVGDLASHNEHLIASVDPGIGLFKNERATLSTPYLPELNEYYGRHCHFRWDHARVEPESLGIIIGATESSLSVGSLDTADLIKQVFALAGISAETSNPGRLANRLIHHMGGLDSCRVFKVSGVRTLIENHRPDQSFTRSAATQTIRAIDTPLPISSYGGLFIDGKSVGSDLKQDGLLAHLLEKSVFRAGLKLECPSCHLDFWTSLDDIRTESTCEYCGHRFNITPLLKDRDWAYRRSGLFGRADNQEGAIPVVLTLQQLNTTYLSSDFLYATATALTPVTASIRPCETDFVALTQRSRDQRIEVAIGECKTRHEITADDVAKLAAVADAFDRSRFDVFIVFAKLSPFSVDELTRIKAVNKDGPRAIILTSRELETYHVYERTKSETGIDDIVVDFSGMAAVTAKVFLAEPAAPNGAQK